MSENAKKRILLIMVGLEDQDTAINRRWSSRAIWEALQAHFPGHHYNHATTCLYLGRLHLHHQLRMEAGKLDSFFRLTEPGFAEGRRHWEERFRLGYGSLSEADETGPETVPAVFLQTA